MQSLIRRISRFAARHFAKSWLPFHAPRGVISFSFDDVPLSACEQGAALLEKHGVRGTFFVCGGLTDQTEQGQQCHSEDILRQLHLAGHELGCHTFSHTHCERADRDQIQADLLRNQDFFKRLQLPLSGFAFPFGAYSFASKLLAKAHFGYARITGNRTMFDGADVYALPAMALYEGRMTPQTLQALIQDVAKRKGWLIFYTHEVTHQPGQWGATPELLRFCIAEAISAGCEVKTIRDAILYFEQARRT